MRYSRTVPGDSPLADAYNLMVAAHHNDERMTKTISARVTDWVAVSAHLAALAGIFAGYADQVTPGDTKPTELFAAHADKQAEIPV